MLVVDVRKKLRDFELTLTLEVPAGITTVVGSSGAGKSTLLRLVAGLLRPDAGSITLNDRVLTADGIFIEPYRRNMGFVFQDYALFPQLSVAENVAYGLRARGVERAQRALRVERILDRFEIRPFADERVGELSGGQRQRVALARALVIEPAALLLDEPLSALDPGTRERVRRELSSLLAAVDVPTVFVTHDAADRAAFGGHCVHIERGRLLPESAG